VEDAAARVSALADGLYYHFRKWKIDGRLREAVREAEGRNRNPTAAVIDSPRW
jgi:hypothetical protein